MLLNLNKSVARKGRRMLMVVRERDQPQLDHLNLTSTNTSDPVPCSVRHFPLSKKIMQSIQTLQSFAPNAFAGPSTGSESISPQATTHEEPQQQQHQPVVATGDWTKDLIHLAKTAELKYVLHIIVSRHRRTLEGRIDGDVDILRLWLNISFSVLFPILTFDAYTRRLVRKLTASQLQEACAYSPTAHGTHTLYTCFPRTEK
jgi:hypothetical protein